MIVQKIHIFPAMSSCFCLAKVSTPFYHAFYYVCSVVHHLNRFFWGGAVVFCVQLFLVVFFVIIVWGLFYDHCCFVLQLLICLLHPVRLVFVIAFIGHIVL